MSLDRRAFGRTLLGGSAAWAALSSLPLPAIAATVSPADETAATVARILAHYGDRLNAQQRARLPRIVAGHIAMLEPIRALAQPNAAPPATVLRLVRGQ